MGALGNMVPRDETYQLIKCACTNGVYDMGDELKYEDDEE